MLSHLFAPRLPPPAADFTWFAPAYADRLGRRYKTMHAALSTLLEGTGPRRTIVETGCVREKDDYGAGYSTMVFGDVLARHGGALHSVDLSEKNMRLCRRVSRRYESLISYNVGDSIAFLAGWSAREPRAPIDLLYLDSWDYPLKPEDGPREPSQAHCLGELNAALPCLLQGSLVLIDDGDLPGGGKPRLAKLRLAELGWHCVLDEYQTLWMRR